ncbi:RdgB/HAM1 family non-canonical purine NTP pyrophosphatase [Ferruginibacter sp. SUN002]|uniref:RdgB/HAM1 family non-canonical purine NTP pyrophosphatase n=1 Tax=Ferruginibacter sp. SUN002 TaxID=2937789 RepID=UPI003D367863
MNTLIFATNNQNKIEEVRKILNNQFNILSLKEAGINIDIPEPHETLEANALEKSSTIYRLTKGDCFSEDTGLEVFALNGEPGVRSARYAGEKASNEDNIEKLLRKMVDIEDRKARFRTIISLIINGKENQFEATCEGTILKERRGGKGFGYDSVFMPEGSFRSFAEMTIEEKNIYSHRKKAIKQLISFLQSV